MRTRSIAVSVAAICFLAAPVSTDSCGIGAPEPVFVTRKAPPDSRGFFRGRIGVLVPSFQRIYLIAAYRILAGGSFSDEEINAFTSSGQQQPTNYYPAGLVAWQTARTTVPGVAIGGVATYKQIQTATSFSAYTNCLDDAFVAASATLHRVADRWGAGSPEVRDWLASQDKVFANCAGTQATIPEEPSSGMDPDLKMEREYQIAAAHFYAGHWDAARRSFERVGHSPRSRWSEIAPYLMARVSLREGMIEARREALEDAFQRFDAIAKDPNQDTWHRASEALRDFTEFRIHAWDRLSSYASELSGQKGSSGLRQHLEDFGFLYQHAEDQEKLAATSDLADWLVAFEGRAKQNHVLDRWRETKSQAWLIQALRYASDDGEISELVTAARALAKGDAGYDSAVYYGIGAELRRGHRDLARVWADQVLSGRLPLSTLNRILYERMKVARDWNEFLHFAPRTPEPDISLYDAQEIPGGGPWSGNGPLFEYDAVEVLNSHVSLQLLLQAVRSPYLSKGLQMQIAQAGFVRSIVLRQDPMARDFMKRAVELNPRFGDAAREILSAPDAEGVHFAGILLMLRSPVVSGILWPANWVPADFHRDRLEGGIRWGFANGYIQFDNNMSVLRLPIDLGFLTPSQRKQGDLEWSLLTNQALCGATYVEKEALKWSLVHQDDPRVPEALHLVVQATYRGCRESETDPVGRRSQQAFLLLQQKYPESQWAKKTKYWYK